MHHRAWMIGAYSIALLFQSQLHGEDVPLTALKQKGLFTLPSNPSRIVRTTSGGGVVWFQVSTGFWNELIATDSAGGNPVQFALHPPSEKSRFPVQSICANAEGSVAVAGDTTVDIYSRNGELKETVALSSPGSDCLFDENLWIWSRKGLDSVSGPRAGLHIASPFPPKTALTNLVGFKDHRVGVVNLEEGILYILDLPSGEWARKALEAPEFQTIRGLPRDDNIHTPLFDHPASSETGFFALSNPIDRKHGARILRFDSEGRLQARYLCPLPASVAPPTATNPNGYLQPTSVVVIDRTILLISWSQKAVEAYDLP
jgi:hypothetical protein